MKNVNIIVPQYHSSFCVDNCSYCGFRKSNKIIPRNRLSDDDYKKELDLLIKWGYKTIEFVFASDRYFGPDKIAKRIEYAKELSEKRNINLRIGLNSEPFDFKGYKILKSAGLDFFVLWMETYSKKQFELWHGLKTPKSNYEYRIEAFDRAIEAGLSNYGMGVLFGLADWKKDVSTLIEHGKKLLEKYKISPYIIGVPRLRPAHSVIFNGRVLKLTDEEFTAATKMYKVAFPKTMLFLNTRESLDLNLKICNNNDLFTIDCGTYPGAFLNHKSIVNGIEQFSTHIYNRDIVLKKFESNKISSNFDW